MSTAPNNLPPAVDLPASAQSPGYVAGQKVRLLENIYDDGQDHHPPCWLAMKGEVLVIRRVHGNGNLGVSHEHRTDASFTIFPHECEPHNSD